MVMTFDVESEAYQQNESEIDSLNSSPNPPIYFMNISTYHVKSVAGGKEINFRATVHEFMKNITCLRYMVG